MTTEPATPPLRRRASPDERRTQILDAAEQLLVERGLDVSVAEVAAAAGIGKGTVYLYFGSRAELLAALRARYLERAVTTFNQQLAAATARGTAAQLVAFAGILFDWSMRSWKLHHVLFLEAGVSEEDAFECGRALILELVTHGVERGEVHVVDPELVARILFDVMHGLLVATMDPANPQRERFDIVVAEVVPRLLGGRDGVAV